MDERAVFVYGTLRPGEPNWRRLLEERAQEWEPAVLADHALYGLGRPFPYAAPKHGAVVYGDYVRILADRWDEALGRLEALEGCAGQIGDRSNHYDRHLVTVTLAGDRHRCAWVYLAGTNAAPRLPERIPTGDWLDPAGDQLRRVG